MIHSMHPEFGKGCANKPTVACDTDKVCAAVTDGAAGAQTCSVQRELPIEDVNMHILNAEMVMPLTKGMPEGQPRSFANLVGGGTPTYFISHNWSGSFKVSASIAAQVGARAGDQGGGPALARSLRIWVSSLAGPCTVFRAVTFTILSPLFATVFSCHCPGTLQEYGSRGQ